MLYIHTYFIVTKNIFILLLAYLLNFHSVANKYLLYCSFVQNYQSVINYSHICLFQSLLISIPAMSPPHPSYNLSPVQNNHTTITSNHNLDIIYNIWINPLPVGLLVHPQRNTTKIHLSSLTVCLHMTTRDC